jgi:hypothetical protein
MRAELPEKGSGEQSLLDEVTVAGAEELQEDGGSGEGWESGGGNRSGDGAGGIKVDRSALLVECLCEVGGPGLRPAADAAKPGNGDRNRRRSHPVSSSTGGVIQEVSIPVRERGGNVLVAF